MSCAEIGMPNPTAYCLLCIHPEGYECLHIFSSNERRQAYADADHGRYLAFYDYAVNEPHRMEAESPFGQPFLEIIRRGLFQMTIDNRA